MKILSNKAEPLLPPTNLNAPSGHTPKGTDLKKLMGNNRGRFATALAILAITFGLVACSGGGGGSTPTTPTSVTVTCPNGTTQTASTTELANTACPAPTLQSVTPTSGSLTTSPDSFTGIQVATDSVLDPASLTTANVTLKVGSLTNVAGTVTATDTKGFKFVPTAKLQYGQTYNFVATVKDMVGKILTVNSTFTTAYVTCTLPQVPNSTGTACVDPTPACTAPAMQNSVGACMLPPAPTGYTWNNIIKAWVADIGVLVTGANTLPATCVTVGDACWLDSVADGTIKLANSGMVLTGQDTRPIIFAFYRIGNSSFFGYYNTIPLYADIDAQAITLNQNVANGGINAAIADVKGSVLGLKQTTPSDGCWEQVWDTGGAWVMHRISCPI